MKPRIFALTLAALIILSACKLSQSVQPGTSTTPTAANQDSSLPTTPATPAAALASGAGKPFDYVFSAAPNPINLQVTLDTDHAAEAVVPVKGGQLQTTGADGTVYTLDIPADSLVVETKIRMTPASSISGLPFGGTQSYAVKLQPEGLILYKDAILTITPPQPIALEKQLFFGYQGDGQDMILAAPVSDSPDMKIRLFHFSGYGATDAEISAKGLSPLGGDGLQEILNLTSEYVTEERIRQRGGTVDNPTLTAEALIDLINQYEEQVVKPALQAAESSCEAGKTAIAALVELARTRQLLGISGAGIFGADLMDLVSKVSQVCVREAYQECVDKHIIYKMIPLWIGLMRQNELLGGERNGPQPEEIKLAEELTTKCLTFELQFDSRGSFDAGGGGYKSEVKAVIRLQFDPVNIIIKGEAPLDSVSFEFTPPAGCTATSTPGGGTFTTIGLAYVTDNHAFDDESEYVRDFKMVYWPGVTSESYHVDCPPGGPSQQESHYTSPPSGYWSGIFFTLHAQELNAGTGAETGPSGAAGMPAMPDLSGLLAGAEAGALPAFPAPAMQEGSGFYLDTWEVPGGELFASREWIKNDSGIGLTESGTFKLYHKPGQ